MPRGTTQHIRERVRGIPLGSLNLNSKAPFSPVITGSGSAQSAPREPDPSEHRSVP